MKREKGGREWCWAVGSLQAKKGQGIRPGPGRNHSHMGYGPLCMGGIGVKGFFLELCEMIFFLMQYPELSYPCRSDFVFYFLFI